MKRSLIVLSAFTFLTACNSGPKTPATTYSLSDSLKFVNDTTGLAAYQAWKAEHELDVNKDQATEKVNTAAVSSAKEATHRTTTKSSGNSGSGTASSGTASSGSTGTTQAKKGWSKTAKGAVIGGVVGAGAGAVINKKNRAAGAVIGGVVGAGAGAVIGHDMDKKDGRH
jgi:cobalamin biosynthesis Mg chelatase CobN